MQIIFEIPLIYEIFKIVIQYFIQTKIVKCIYITQIHYRLIIMHKQADNM